MTLPKVAILIVTGSLSFAIAQSQPPSPSPGKSTQEQQGKRTNEQYGQSPSQPSVSISVNNSRDANEQKNAPASTDGWVTIFTAVLAITAVFQYFIYRKQTQVMADALAETTKAADAAKESAIAAKRSTDILINGERAWILINNPRSTPFWDTAKTQFQWFRFDITNHGKTVARLMEFRAASICLAVDAPLPESPSIGERVGPDGIIFGSVLAPGQSQNDIAFPLVDLHNSGWVEAVMGLQRNAWVYGYVRYFDFAEEERILRFCYLFVAAERSWVPAGPPPYTAHT